jgi:hypothetical protein
MTRGNTLPVGAAALTNSASSAAHYLGSPTISMTTGILANPTISTTTGILANPTLSMTTGFLASPAISTTTGILASPAIPTTTGIRAKYAPLTAKRSRVYVLMSIWVVVCAGAHLYLAAAVVSNALLWLSYYVVNYQFGFVRRGLAGELIRIFPFGDYFTAAYAVLWGSTVLWLIALTVLAWLILSAGRRSGRRMMLALVVPVLPFAFSYAIYSPHPEIFGMTALLAFSISLTRVRTARSRMILSALYGIAMAVLALMHEAIPLEFAFGATLAIIVLAKDATRRARRICTVLAVGPGIVFVLLVAGLGRRDVGSQLCTQIPHGMVERLWPPYATPQYILDYLLGRVERQSDYHDWMCANLTPMIDVDAPTALKLVANWGVIALFCALLLGMLYFVGTTWIIGYSSGVPLRVFLNEFRNKLMSPALALALAVPLFVTAVDWTRWMVLITFDVSIVYILYAICRPEIEQTPSRRNVLVFVWVVILLAVIPTGAANNVGTY